MGALVVALVDGEKPWGTKKKWLGFWYIEVVKGVNIKHLKHISRGHPLHYNYNIL